MKLNHSTELMKNQKHAVIMAPDRQFEVLHTQGGHSLFFSIGTDNKFYCTREIPTDTVGWGRQDLSSGLSANYGGAPVTAKNFDVFQAPDTGAIEIVLVINVNGTDHLYTATGISNSDTSWNNMNITWTEVAFDDPNHGYAGHPIADVYVTKYTGTPMIIVDVLKDPTSPIKTVFRYFVDQTKTIAPNHAMGAIAWIPQDLAGNLEAGTIVSKQGRRQGQTVDGIYTIGSLVSQTEIFYTPAYDAFTKKGQPLGAPDPVTFVLPDGVSQMAVVPNKSKYTDLYLAGGGSLYYLSAVNQKQDAVGVTIYSDALLQGVESLHVNTSGKLTIVWGLNEAGQVFYLSCAVGSEANPAAWSIPVPILDNVATVSTYIDSQAGNGVIFAHRNDDTLVQLTRDTTTGIWQQRSIVLPSTDTDDYVEMYTFTTHVQCNDDDNVPMGYANVTITPTNDCSVYINDVYHKMYANVQLAVVADSRGVINIQQAVDNLAGICFNINTGAGDPVNVNPMSDILARLSNVKSGSDLDITVTDEHGNTKPLVGSNITADQKDQIAQYIQQFVQLQSDVPADGSQVSDDSSAANNAVATPAAAAGRSLAAAPMVTAMGISIPANFDPTQTVKIWAGDGWNWLKSEFENVKSFFIQKVGAINHFFVELGDVFYEIALRCVHDIAQGINFVLNKIEVAFEDLVKWLGSIFAWVDILRTHSVIKNFFTLYGKHCISNIDTFKDMLTQWVTDAEASLDQWSGMPTSSYRSKQQAGGQDSGQNSPSSNWGTHHTQNNMNKSSTTLPDNPLAEIGQDLISALVKEGDIIATACDRIKAVFGEIDSISMGDLFKKILDIILDGILDSGENVLTEFLNICEALLDGVMDVLDKPLNIPVISPIYKLFAKSDLSFMDLACLVVAIPATVLYKLANGGDAPFPDNDTTSALLGAKTYEDFVAVIFPPSQVAPAAAFAPAFSSAPTDTLVAKANIVVWDPKDPAVTRVQEGFAWIGNCVGAIGGAAMSILGLLKLCKFAGAEPAKQNITIATGAFYFPYVMPSVVANMQGFNDPLHKGANSGNVILSAFAVLRGLADVAWTYRVKPGAEGEGVDQPVAPGAGIDPATMTTPQKLGGYLPTWWEDASPWLDFTINLLWEIPVALDYCYSKRGIDDEFNLIGGTLFNFSGVLSPFIAIADKTKNPQWVGALTFLGALCNGGYAAMCVLVDFDQQEG